MKPSISLAQQIAATLTALAPGEPFISSMFLEHGSRANVDQSLSRLAKRKIIVRIARGIYLKPKKNRFVGTVLPEPLKIAQTLAQTTGHLIQVNGAEAARQFGLSTQMPTRPVFLTNGQSRHFRIGKLEITLKHVAPRKLILTGTKAGLAITALWYLGKKQVNHETINKIKNQMTKKEYDLFKSAIGSMPAWLSNILRYHEQEASHE